MDAPQPEPGTPESAAPAGGASAYEVVLLVEQALSSQDAAQVHSLHEELVAEGQTVHYTVLHPVEDAAVRVENAVGALGTSGDLLPTALLADATDVEELEQEVRDAGRRTLADSVAALEATGATATGTLISVDPVDGLVEQVKQSHAAEVIVLTSPHVFAEFFHVDWTSRARRKLDVPVLHLLEHETFDEQAGEGEGVTGL